MSTYTKEDYMRSVQFKADSEGQLLEALANITGYDLVPIAGTDRSFSPDQKFLLVSAAGQEIMIQHKDGERFAETGNVFGQDAKEEPTAVVDDEVVKLCLAAQSVDGLSAAATQSNHDMQFSREQQLD